MNNRKGNTFPLAAYMNAMRLPVTPNRTRRLLESLGMPLVGLVIESETVSRYATPVCS